MFIHQSQLRPLLRAEQYFSESQHRTELAQLFLPGWHPVAVRSQLRLPGSFRTLELLGTPLLLRNVDGEIRAFLNVCPHRHSRLTSKTSGHSERLRCQYHGWEFDGDGRTGRIPDAKAFRPWDRENSCLKRFRVGMAGELIFVSLAESGPSFEEFFAPAGPLWGGGFAEPFRFAAMWSQEFPCNWKVILENSLESYHVPEIHAATFGAMPTEESCEHDLQREYTSFSTVLRKEFGTRILNGLAKSLGAEVTGRYHHLNLHPHVTLTRVDLYRQIMFLEPSGPESCRFHNLIFTLRGKPFRPLRWLLAQMTRAAVLHVAKKVFREDGSIYSAVQRGTMSSPFPGVIGTREERIHYFQQFVSERCGLSTPADPARSCHACASSQEATL
jgi:choline monooxygenase